MDTQITKSEYLQRLENAILEIAPDKKLALAFSAGVDSTILLHVMRNMGCDVLAVTFNTNLTRRMISISNATDYAKKLGVKHVVLDIDVMSVPEVHENSKMRCYHCKSRMFAALADVAKQNGYSVLCDGTNADDLKEYRPGLKAKEECGVHSPIALAGLAKDELRAIGRELSLDIASKPSSPCLLTRFPYDITVTEEMLETVESGEEILHDAGFPACRLRVHGDTARIEIPCDRFTDFTDKKELLIPKLKQLGFRYITLDLDGLHSGSMDQTIRN